MKANGMHCFRKYMSAPTSCPVINTKLVLLCSGVDVDSTSLAREYPRLQEEYKTSKSVVSC